MKREDMKYIKQVEKISKQSNCIRRKVGAIMVQNETVISEACNGNPSKCRTCIRNEVKIQPGVFHNICYGIHAEMRMLQLAKSKSFDIKNAVVYCTHSPCRNCAQALVNTGIRKFIYMYEYPDNSFKSIFKQAGVEYKKLEGEKGNDH